MNNVYLCVGKYAKKPFYVNFSDISLYSIEELCYYFIEKIYLLDYDMIGQELVDWIREECGLTALADELDVYVRKRMSVAAFVTTILEATDLYDKETVRKVDRILKEQADLSPYERLKKRAEYLYGMGRFRQALAIFTQLLQQTPAADAAGRAVLYYDMASVYAMDYDYVQAANYYREAYRLEPRTEYRRMYLLATRKSMTDFDYGVLKRENAEWQDDFAKVEEMLAQTARNWQESKERGMLEEIAAARTAGEVSQYKQQTGELLEQLKQDYRRQTT